MVLILWENLQKQTNASCYLLIINFDLLQIFSLLYRVCGICNKNGLPQFIVYNDSARRRSECGDILWRKERNGHNLLSCNLVHKEECTLAREPFQVAIDVVGFAFSVFVDFQQNIFVRVFVSFFFINIFLVDIDFKLVIYQNNICID